jgi:thioredoxin reductase (NADPH)
MSREESSTPAGGDAAAAVVETADIIIAGAGPVGLACAIAAKRGGFGHLVLEKGCLASSLYRFPRQMTFFTTPERLEIGGHPLVSSRDKPSRHEALEYYRGVARAEGLQVRTYEEVLRVEGELGAFLVHSRSRDGERLRACRRIIIATGYYDNPNLLGIPGEELPHVSHYYGEAHPYAGERVLVVGGRNSAAEAALDLHRHGAAVTLVHRKPALGATIKYWVRPDIENRLAAGEIRGRFSTRVVEIRPRSALLAPVDGAEWSEEPFDHVFLLTGYHPDAAFLERCGLKPDPRTLKVALDPETLESRDVPGIHLAGSAGAGRYTGNVFIENGRFDCERIFLHLEGRRGGSS